MLVHDIRHELGTVKLLAAALSTSVESSAESLLLAGRLSVELRRLDELMAALIDERPVAGRGRQASPAVRLDVLTQGVVAPLRLTTGIDITVTTTEVRVPHDRVELWRALRNVVGNAVTAVGPSGRIEVSLARSGTVALLDVDDDGPGMAVSRPRAAHSGLAVIAKLTSGWGGWFDVAPSPLGGCRVRLAIPLTPVGPALSGPERSCAS